MTKKAFDNLRLLTLLRENYINGPRIHSFFSYMAVYPLLGAKSEFIKILEESIAERMF